MPFELTDVFFEKPLCTPSSLARLSCFVAVFKAFRRFLSPGLPRSRVLASCLSSHRVCNSAFTSSGAHQPLGPCLCMTGGSLVAVDSKASASVVASSSTQRVVPGGRGVSVDVISLLRSVRRPWSAINRCRSIDGFPLPVFVLRFDRKPAQEANVSDHEVVIGFVPLLWWSPHCDVADKAPINLSCM